MSRFPISEEGLPMVKKSDKSSEVIEAAVKTAKVKAAEVKEAVAEVKEATESKAKEVKAATEKKAKQVKAAAETKVKAVKAAGAAKKTEPKCKVIVEFAGQQIDTEDTLKAAIKAYKAAHKGVEIKTVELYIKPEEHAAYYVVNGDAAPEYRIEL